VNSFQNGVALDEATRDELLENIRLGATRIGDAVARIQPLAKVDPGNEPASDIRSIADETIAALQNELRHRAPVDVRIETTRGARVSRGELRIALLSVVMSVVRQLDADTTGSHIRRVQLSVFDDGNDVILDVSSRVDSKHQRAPQRGNPPQQARPLGSFEPEPDVIGFVSRIIELARGSFVVDHDPDRGVCATIRLPALTHTSGVAEGSGSLARPSLDVHALKPVVLIIDDDPLVLRVLVRALANFEVVGSTSALASAEALKSGAIDPAVLLCDVMMPGMAGWEFHEFLSRQSPHLLPRLVFMTGGTFTGRSRDFVMRNDVKVVMKPLALSEIRSVVESMAALRRSREATTALPITPTR
jgi:two-component system NtrC family sensor kinase